MTSPCYSGYSHRLRTLPGEQGQVDWAHFDHLQIGRARRPLRSDSALRRRLHRYATPDVLVIDEVGYLSYWNRHADLLFELISRRYGAASTVATTNRPFAEWSEVFPNAACVVSLVDRLAHRAEVVADRRRVLPG